MAKSKSPMARVSINARETRMTTFSPSPEPVVSQSRHGRPVDGAQLAGGRPREPRQDRAGRAAVFERHL